MLLKLIKHNLKPIIKSILPFVVLLFASVALFNFTAYEPEDVYAIRDDYSVLVDTILPSDFQLFLHGLANFMISCSVILLFAAAIRSIWRRFSANFYGDEAYLTHTLPIKRSTLWNAQILSIFIVFVTIIAVIALNCLFITVTPSGFRLLGSLGLISGCPACVGDYYHIEPLALGFYLTYCLVVFMELTFLTFCGITGIIIKNRLGNKYAILSGVAIYMLSSLLLIGLFYLISNFDSAILGILNGAPMYVPGWDIDTSYMMRALLYIGLIYCVYCAALYATDQKLLKRGINLD